MTNSWILILSILSAALFLMVRGTSRFAARPLLKAVMAALLALYCWQANPALLWPMAIGFALSALGDWFLDLPNDRFMQGLISFFIAHIAFLVFLAPHSLPLSALTASDILLGAGVIISTFVFYVWLRPSLDAGLRFPVATYTFIIALMGAAAVTTNLPSILVPIGAILFILSDLVLSIERFKTGFSGAKHLNWFLYASGQVLLAIGAVASVT